jgi:hypothetical protein
MAFPKQCVDLATMLPEHPKMPMQDALRLPIFESKMFPCAETMQFFKCPVHDRLDAIVPINKNPKRRREVENEERRMSKLEKWECRK